jgi:L-ascorbate metabolism protein UlaG (beta-lactamase superfamily)
MDITYLGHSSFRIKGKSATVVTDPFDPDFVGLKFTKGTTADIVTISHSHTDHNRSDLVKDVKRIVNGPGEYEIAGVSIIGMPTFHDDKKGEARGRNTVYVFEIDELRIVHLGDIGHKFSEEELDELGTVDVLMVPVGGFYTVEVAIAVEIVRSIEPSFTIPMHYKVPGMKEDFAKLAPVETFLKEIGLTVERADKFSIKKSDITEEDEKVIVLEVKP